jgi:hypothetical protein
MQRYLDVLSNYGALKFPIPGAAVVTERFIRVANSFDRAEVARIARELG